ncbi:hypothetical protein ACKWTF_002366 [Chironomus riparius]
MIPEICIKYNRIAHEMLNEVIIQQQPCDKFSTWEFESYMTPIKNLVHGPKLPLSQMFRRITEYFNCPNNLVPQKNLSKKGKTFLYYQGIRIDTKDCRDRFFLTKQKDLIVILKIVNFEKCQFLCRRLKIIEDFFLKPIVASKLNFFHASTQYEGEKFLIDMTQIERKLMCMITEEDSLFFAPISNFT